MPGVPGEAVLAYCGYLAWLCAGLGDFIAHRRTDLPHTSGVAESAMHLVQLGLLGTAIVSGLAFDVGRGSALLIGVLVVAHAGIGYIDSRIAFTRRRVVSPVEQHLHSVLDMAPIVAFASLLLWTWPAAVHAGWDFRSRQPVVAPAIWIAVLLPAIVLCVVPALLEFRAAWLARRAPRG